MVRRITIEYDPSEISFSDGHRLTGAMCILEELSEEKIIAMEVVDVRSKGTLNRRPRADKKDEADLSLHPQQKQVLNLLKAHPSGLTKPDLADSTDISLNSLGGVLNTLRKRGLVENSQEVPSPKGRRNLKVWQISEGKDANS